MAQTHQETTRAEADLVLLATAWSRREAIQFTVLDAFDGDAASDALGRVVRFGDGIALRAEPTRQVVGIDLRQSKERGALRASVPWIRSWERFVLEHPPEHFREPHDHSLALRASYPFALLATNGRYVTCDLGGDHGLFAGVTYTQEWELFRVFPPA